MAIAPGRMQKLKRAAVGTCRFDSFIALLLHGAADRFGDKHTEENHELWSVVMSNDVTGPTVKFSRDEPRFRYSGRTERLWFTRQSLLAKAQRLRSVVH